MKSKYTEEERAAWREKMRQLAQTVRELPQEEQEKLAAQYGTVTCEGHALSPFNCIFLANQTGRILAIVGGCRQWGKAGRKVVKGEKAAGYIYVPMGQEVKEDGEEGRMKFRLVPVFDVSQTEEGAA